MARRGGFGDPNGGGKMQGQMLPFAVDPSLEDEAKKREETQSLFPVSHTMGPAQRRNV